MCLSVCGYVLTVNITVMCSNHFLLTRVGNESAAITVVGWLIFSHSSIRDVYPKQKSVVIYFDPISQHSGVFAQESAKLIYLLSSSTRLTPRPLLFFLFLSPLPFLFPLPSLSLSPPLPLPSPSYPPFFLLRTR